MNGSSRLRFGTQQWLAIVGGFLVICLAVETAMSAVPGTAETKPGEISPPADEPPRATSPLELDDPLEPFKPKQPIGDTEVRRVEALALFAAARMAEAQDNYPEALRLYQRALQYDPRSLVVVRQVIKMAQAIDRTAEATRFTLKAIELDPRDPELLDDAIRHLTQSGKFAEAVKLYEDVIEQLELNPKTNGYIHLRLQMGQLYFVTDQFEPAADALAEVMQALENPKDYGLRPDLIRMLEGNKGRFFEMCAESFLAAERPELARKAFDRLQQKWPNPALHAYRMARVLTLEQKFAEALDELQQYFAAHGTDAELAPYELLERVLKILDRADEFLPRLEQLAAEDEENAALGYYLAGEYLAAEQWDKAEPLLRKLAADEPLAYRGLLAVYRRTKEPAKLLETLTQVVEQSNGLELVSRELRDLAGDQPLVDRVIELAREQTSPDKPNDEQRGAALARALAVGLLALEAKRYDDAGEFFAEAVRLSDDERAPQLYLTWGLGLLLSDQFAAAAAVLQQGIDAGALSDNATTFFYMAYALERDNQTDKAIEAARKAAELGDSNPQIASRLAWIYYHARRYPEAAREYSKLVTRYDSDFSSETVREVVREARLILSNIAVLQDNIPEAEEWLEQVLDEFPDDPSALNDLGYLWADQGKNLERALEMIRNAVAAEPENTAYLDSLAWVLYRLGRPEEALPHMLKAAGGESPDGVILDHLGDIYLAAGNVKAARAAWKRAAAAFDANTEADKLAAVRAKLARHKP